MSTDRLDFFGIYKIVSARNESVALDIRDGRDRAEGYTYAGFASQQWNVTSSDGFYWKLRNVATGKYLGLPLEDIVSDGSGTNLHLCGVDYPFSWFLEKDSTGHIRIRVPHTHICLWFVYADRLSSVQTIEFINGDEHPNMPGQHWIFSKDLESAITTALSDGKMYKVVSVGAADIVLTTKMDRFGPLISSGQPYDASENQHYQAWEIPTGWAFKNIWSALFLGTALTTGMTTSQAVTAVDHVFTWMVVPDTEDKTMFRLWIPYTGHLLALQENNAKGMGLLIAPPSQSKNLLEYWRFEEVEDTATSY